MITKPETPKTKDVTDELDAAAIAKREWTVIAIGAIVMALVIALGVVAIGAMLNAMERELYSMQHPETRPDAIRIEQEKKHNEELDLEAKKAIADAPDVQVRIPDLAPTLETCRTVVWTIPAKVIQTPGTALDGRTDRYKDDILTLSSTVVSYAHTKPVVVTNFKAAHDYIASHPELKSSTEPTCDLEGSVNMVHETKQFKSDELDFPKGTTFVGLPYSPQWNPKW
jgi:hypothetical protein